MANIQDLADRVERLLLRHEELQRAHALLQQHLLTITQERDNLRSRLSAARLRIDVLLDRLPREPAQQGLEAPAAASARPTADRREPSGADEAPPGAPSTTAAQHARGES